MSNEIIPAKSTPVAAPQVSITQAAAKMFGCPPERVYDLCRNFWPQGKNPPLTNAECWTGLTLSVKYGLDPAAKEIYVMRTRDKIACAIGIDGWIKILDSTEGYDGFDQALEFDGEKLLWVETTIHSTRRSHPIRYRAYAQEYARMAGMVAEKMPWHMLRIFSLRHAARLFAPIGGNVVTEEEARWLNSYADAPADAPPAKALKSKVKAAAMEYQADPPPPPPAPEPESQEPEAPPEPQAEQEPPFTPDAESQVQPEGAALWRHRLELADNVTQVTSICDSIDVDLDLTAAERVDLKSLAKARQAAIRAARKAGRAE